MQLATVFLIPNWTFFVELVIFLCILAIITKKVLPPLNAAMDKRQEQIRTSLEAADKARTDAAAADDERRTVIEEARIQAREIVAQANKTADQVKADMTTKGQAEYDRIVATAASEVALARQRAVEEAAAAMGTVVLEVVEKIVGREVDAAAHQELISEAVATLRAEAATTGTHA